MLISEMPIQVNWHSLPVCRPRPERDDDQLELAEEWIVTITTRSETLKIHIPKRFCFQGSVPRFAWRICTPTDPDSWAGFAIHDFLYLLTQAGLFRREWADECLYLALRKCGKNAFVSWGMFRAVRAFGGDHVKGELNTEENGWISDAKKEVPLGGKLTLVPIRSKFRNQPTKPR